MQRMTRIQCCDRSTNARTQGDVNSVARNGQLPLSMARNTAIRTVLEQHGATEIRKATMFGLLRIVSLLPIEQRKRYAFGGILERDRVLGPVIIESMGLHKITVKLQGKRRDSE